MEEISDEEKKRDVVIKQISLYIRAVHCEVVMYTPLPTPKTFYCRCQILIGLMKAKVSLEHGVVSHSGIGLPLFMKCLF
jgi:hypothetical protein